MSEYVPPPPPPPSNASTANVPNNLIFAILVTIFCCLPFGVVAIIFAAQVNSKLAAGDVAGAEDASKKAKTWCWVAFFVGILTVVISLILSFVGFLPMLLYEFGIY